MSDWKIRLLRPSDYPAVWRWRNDAVTRSMERSPDPVAWPAFEDWLRQMTADSFRCLMVADRQEGAFAFSHVRMDPLSGSAEIGINISPEYRGQRLATPLIEAFCRYASARLGFRRIKARVKSVNVASRRAFARAGFRRDGEAEGIVFLWRDLSAVSGR